MSILKNLRTIFVVIDNGDDVLIAVRMPDHDGSSSVEIRTTGPVYLDEADQAEFDMWLAVDKKEAVTVSDFTSIDFTATEDTLK